MEQVKIKAIGMQDQYVSKCPICGGTPHIKVSIEDTPLEEKQLITDEEVYCYCGFSTSRKFWNELASLIDTPYRKRR